MSGGEAILLIMSIAYVGLVILSYMAGDKKDGDENEYKHKKL